jgi:protein-S-isoprenylcysteine O-methyltransferase Ste14
MSTFSPLRRRAPWVAGALLLALVGLPLVAAGLRFGLQRWPFLLGAGAALLLLAGWAERWWQSRPATRTASRSRSRAGGRFRLVEGGRNAQERSPGVETGDENDDEPKWLM